MKPQPPSGSDSSGLLPAPVLLPTPEGTARAYFSPDGLMHVLNLTPTAQRHFQQLGLPVEPEGSRIPLPKVPCRMGLGLVDVPEDQLPLLDLETLWILHQAPPLAAALPRATSRLRLKLEIARRLAEPCNLCEHRCQAKRDRGQGWCRAPLNPSQLQTVLHVGEEVGQTLCLYLGPGCSHGCRFCTMHELVNAAPAKPLEASKVAAEISEWGQQGATSLTVIGGEPGIYLPWILQLLLQQPSLPLVWNSNFYHTPEVARLLEGVVDVHVADLKFGNDGCARRLAGVHRYLEPLKRNLHQASVLGIPVVVRHVVMPGHLECCTYPALKTMAEVIPSAQVHLMPYLPAWKGPSYGLERFTSDQEMRAAHDLATRWKLTTL